MKKVAIFAFSALFALGFASCTKDGSEVGGGVTPTGDELTFVISGAIESGITYATVAPETGESTVSTFDVLQFTWDTDEFVDKYAGLTVVPEGTKLKVTISGVTKHATSTQYRYVVVANGSAHASIAKAALAGKTWAEVKELLTDKNASKIGLPLLITGESTTAAGTTGVVPVTGKRSVARFDILKKADANQKTLDISKVIIRDAFQEAPIFYMAAGTATRTDKMNFEVEDDADLDGTGLLTYVAQGTDGDKIAKSVFYLNPTTVSTSGSTTSISIEASFDGGTAKLYHINGPVTISPNYRYTLIANPENLTIELLIADWDDDDEEHYFEGNDNFSLSSFAATGTGIWDAINKLYTPDGNEAVLTMAFKASSSAGVTVSPEVIIAGGPAITVESIDTDNAITYATPGYTSTVTVKVAAGDVSSAFSTRLKVTDAANPSTSYEVVISKVAGTVIGEDGEEVVIYEPAGLPAVKFSNLWWAPVNIGSKSIQDPGAVFQWGRNTPFYRDNVITSSVGQVSYSDIESGGIYENIFIAVDPSITPIPANWLTVSNDNLWQNVNDQPCPSGWRMPTHDEIGALSAYLNSNAREYEDDCLVFLGDDGISKLYHALDGIISREGNKHSAGTNVFYWSSSVVEDTALEKSYWVYFGRGSRTVTPAPAERNNSASIRCVKDVTVTP